MKTNKRRLELIQKKYAGGLNPEETKELAELQDWIQAKAARQHPLPVELLDRIEGIFKKSKPKKG